jgi:hypothetical protein
MVLFLVKPAVVLVQKKYTVPNLKKNSGQWRSVDGTKLHRGTHSGDFIPYNLPEFFQGCEKLEKFTGA